MSYPIRRRLDAKQTAALVNGGGMSESIFVPGPKPAAVRLLVKDVATGSLGSIYIMTENLVTALARETGGSGASQP